MQLKKMREKRNAMILFIIVRICLEEEKTSQPENNIIMAHFG